ncbi:hypothetical protein SAMD00019534_092100 [Acytostelium subglobosum LB1]|uniref:hypothetical protein n=1 Tax=Acytostelium subglobosum LB1 TaxID=1410327 RepID=UPI0006448F60|nr:hypothetical protein SAMD00019534_092100 [Acytostelium subglobosum LB1]GAM26035.1 hypothetical protein SAMD00019534_092100 [Acytostelium subglobosum LB1]|eukprot:XP_012751078.1 hypothetical protein SAMD00019534_092100 [Acytostelium subglobosum LB1]
MNGGAIFANSSSLNLQNVQFLNNVAEFGSSIYATSSKLTCSNCMFTGNKALRSGALYLVSSTAMMTSTSIKCNSNNDIVLFFSSSVFKYSNISSASISCDDSVAYTSQSGQLSGSKMSSLCGNDAVCTSPPSVFNPSTHFASWEKSNSPSMTCNNDSVCESDVETCLSCPSDCKCKFSGSKLSVYTNCPPSSPANQSCPLPTYPLPMESFDIPNLYTTETSYGNIFGYFAVDISGEYQIDFEQKFLGINVMLNGKPVVTSMAIQSHSLNSVTTRLRSTNLNTLNISFITPPSKSYGSLKVVLSGGDKLTSKVIDLKSFFSNNYAIQFDNYEVLCKVETGGTPLAYCGDNVCSEVPEDCVEDCYDQLGYKCSHQVPPFNVQIPDRDTISYLITQQQPFSLPGLIHMSHGVGLLTGDELPAPIFDQGYCSNLTYSIIQDFNRGVLYMIPPEYNAELSPSCSYNSVTSTYSNSYDYQTEMSDESSMSVGFGANGGYGGWGGSASAAYSQSKSVAVANQIQGSKSGQFYSTKVKCLTSSVTRNNFHFSTKFLKELSAAQDDKAMEKVIGKYGAFYYLSATLGGSLEVLVFADSSTSFFKKSVSLTHSASIQAAMQFSTPYGGGGASFSGSQDSTSDEDTQKSFTTNTTHSEVLVKGGDPGSFGPDFNSHSSFGSWSQSVDLRPVPINFKLDLIGNIIPRAWRTSNGKRISDLWAEGFQLYVKNANVTRSPIVNQGVYFNFLTLSNQTRGQQNLNISIILNNVVDGSSLLYNITVDNVGCDEGGCQQKLRFELPTERWEVGSIQIVYYNETVKAYLPFNSSNYFDELNILFVAHQYSRIYLFFPSPVAAPTQVNSNVSIPIPAGWVDPPPTLNTTIGPNSVTVVQTTLTSSNATGTVIITNITSITTYEIASLSPTYPTPGTTIITMTTKVPTTIQSPSSFFAIPVGLLGVNTIETTYNKSNAKLIGSQYYINTHRIVENQLFIGSIQDFDLVVPTEDSGIMIVDDVFIMIVCPNDPLDPMFQLCVDPDLDGQTSLGYMKVTTASYLKDVMDNGQPKKDGFFFTISPELIR